MKDVYEILRLEEIELAKVKAEARAVCPGKPIIEVIYRGSAPARSHRCEWAEPHELPGSLQNSQTQFLCGEDGRSLKALSHAL